MEKYQQKTIKHEISCVGIGLHTGNKISMMLKPAEVNTGIIFHRTDISGQDAYIPAHHDYVVDTRMCTCIGNKDGVKVATIEHLMAAIHAMGINNMLIEINGPETPVMDGSSAPFVFLLECAGVKAQNAALKAIRILKPVSVKNGDKEVCLRPAEKGLKMLEPDPFAPDDALCRNVILKRHQHSIHRYIAKDKNQQNSRQRHQIERALLTHQLQKRTPAF